MRVVNTIICPICGKEDKFPSDLTLFTREVWEENGDFVDEKNRLINLCIKCFKNNSNVMIPH